MTTAYVLFGGASLGAAQVGMLAVLSDAGIRPDLVVGTSVGAEVLRIGGSSGDRQGDPEERVELWHDVGVERRPAFSFRSPGSPPSRRNPMADRLIPGTWSSVCGLPFRRVAATAARAGWWTPDLDHALDPAAARAVASHLHECWACSGAVETT